MMDRILCEVERDPHYRTLTDSTHPTMSTIADVICNALRQAAVTLPLAAVVTYTASGASGLAAARERPPAPILSLSPGVAVARRLSLVWGLHSVPTSYASDVSEIVSSACAIAVREGFANPGDIIAIAAGMPFGVSGTTNLLRIERIPQSSKG
jgi:pyruvate kinase